MSGGGASGVGHRDIQRRIAGLRILHGGEVRFEHHLDQFAEPVDPLDHHLRVDRPEVDRVGPGADRERQGRDAPVVDDRPFPGLVIVARQQVQDRGSARIERYRNPLMPAPGDVEPGRRHHADRVRHHVRYLELTTREALDELDKDPVNFIFNQFCEFSNHLGHYEVTGRAFGHVFETVRDSMKKAGRDISLAAFTSATGSAGTIAAGDRLKDDYGAKIVSVEALECPTMLENGFGEHNIQGIGDKHIPLIHNITNSDVICGISDQATDELDVLFNTPAGRAYLAEKKGLSAELIDALAHFGFSSICNTLAAIKTSKLLNLGPDEAVITVATDGGALYPSSRVTTLAKRFNGEMTAVDAAEVFGRHFGHVTTEDMIECTERDRNRIFNLGYYTWVEQQGTPFELFEARRDQSFWKGLRRYLPIWDEMITDFNARVTKG